MRPAGITLLEIVVALSIATVLFGLAGFGYRDLRHQWQLQATVRQIVLDLRMSRIGAIAEARTHRLRFDPAADAYWREVQADGGKYVDARVPRVLPAGVAVTRCTAPGGSIAFRPRGNAATFGTVSLRGHTGETRDIVVDMVGRVQVRR